MKNKKIEKINLQTDENEKEEKNKEKTINKEKNKEKIKKIEKKDKKSVKKTKKKINPWIWPLKIFIIALILSFTFSVLSEMVFSVVGIVVSVLVILLLLTLGVICDMIGVAVTSANIEPYTAMRAKKVRGSKEAMKLVKNAEKISSICNDVIGDICGILTGAAGAVIALKIVPSSIMGIERILIVSSISAIIAGLTIFGKAGFKKIAMEKSTKIVLAVGKCLSVFSIKKKKKAKKNVKKTKS